MYKTLLKRLVLATSCNISHCHIDKGGIWCIFSSGNSEQSDVDSQKPQFSSANIHIPVRVGENPALGLSIILATRNICASTE